MTAPLVSIVIPSYNQAAFLGATLDSVLGQSHRPLEVIVADGGSGDGSVEILRARALRHPELRWISEKDHGPADGVNKGLALARGEIIGIQNSDDLYHPGALAAAVQAFAADPECGMVYGDVEGIGRGGEHLYTRTFPDYSWDALCALSWCIPQSSIFFRRELYAQLGGWNPAYFGADLEYWMRLSFHTRVRHLPACLSSWRRYPEQRTTRAHFQEIWDGYWTMLRDSAELRSAPPRVRRLARASAHLLALRFYPDRNRLAVLAHALCGIALHPGALRHYPVREYLQRAFARLGGKVA